MPVIPAGVAPQPSSPSPTQSPVAPNSPPVERTKRDGQLNNHQIFDGGPTQALCTNGEVVFVYEKMRYNQSTLASLQFNPNTLFERCDESGIPNARPQPIPTSQELDPQGTFAKSIGDRRCCVNSQASWPVIAPRDLFDTTTLFDTRRRFFRTPGNSDHIWQLEPQIYLLPNPNTTNPREFTLGRECDIQVHLGERTNNPQNNPTIIDTGVFAGDAKGVQRQSCIEAMDGNSAALQKVKQEIACYSSPSAAQCQTTSSTAVSQTLSQTLTSTQTLTPSQTPSPTPSSSAHSSSEHTIQSTTTATTTATTFTSVATLTSAPTPTPSPSHSTDRYEQTSSQSGEGSGEYYSEGSGYSPAASDTVDTVATTQSSATKVVDASTSADDYDHVSTDPIIQSTVIQSTVATQTSEATVLTSTPTFTSEPTLVPTPTPSHSTSKIAQTSVYPSAYFSVPSDEGSGSGGSGEYYSEGSGYSESSQVLSHTPSFVGASSAPSIEPSVEPEPSIEPEPSAFSQLPFYTSEQLPLASEEPTPSASQSALQSFMEAVSSSAQDYEYYQTLSQTISQIRQSYAFEVPSSVPPSPSELARATALLSSQGWVSSTAASQKTTTALEATPGLSASPRPTTELSTPHIASLGVPEDYSTVRGFSYFAGAVALWMVGKGAYQGVKTVAHKCLDYFNKPAKDTGQSFGAVERNVHDGFEQTALYTQAPFFATHDLHNLRARQAQSEPSTLDSPFAPNIFELNGVSFSIGPPSMPPFTATTAFGAQGLNNSDAPVLEHEDVTTVANTDSDRQPLLQADTQIVDSAQHQMPPTFSRSSSYDATRPRPNNGAGVL